MPRLVRLLAVPRIGKMGPKDDRYLGHKGEKPKGRCHGAEGSVGTSGIQGSPILVFLEFELRGGAVGPHVIAWTDIEEYRRGPRDSIEAFINEMEAKWQRTEAVRSRKTQG